MKVGTTRLGKTAAVTAWTLLFGGLVGLLLFAIISEAWAGGKHKHKRPAGQRVDKMGHRYKHKHCRTHRHHHGDGTQWHDRYSALGDRWESIRLNPGPSNGTWGIDENQPKPVHVGKKYRHCIVHSHSHVNAGHYHAIDGDWESFRMD